jgi:hypothetical protein
MAKTVIRYLNSRLITFPNGSVFSKQDAERTALVGAASWRSCEAFRTPVVAERSLFGPFPFAAALLTEGAPTEVGP